MSDVYLIDGNDLKLIADNLREHAQIVTEFSTTIDAWYPVILGGNGQATGEYSCIIEVEKATNTDVIYISSISTYFEANLIITTSNNKIGIKTLDDTNSSFTITGILFHTGTGTGTLTIPAGQTSGGTMLPVEEIGQLQFPNDFISIYNSITSHTPYTIEDLMDKNIYTINDTSVSYLRSMAFRSHSQLTKVIFNECLSIGIYTFSYCTQLSYASFPKCTLIGSYAFQQCSALKNIHFPNCEILNDCCFLYCNGLLEVTLLKCSNIGSGAFQLCEKLTNFNAPECSIIGSKAFYMDTNLIKVNIPNCESIGTGAFSGCTKLTTINLSKCKYIGENGLAGCKQLTSITMPQCSIISPYTFAQCENLTTISLPSCSYIDYGAFRECFNLVSLFLMNSNIVSVSSTYINIFESTPIANYSNSTQSIASIYVPLSLVSNYIADTYWQQYANKIVGVDQ